MGRNNVEDGSSIDPDRLAVRLSRFYENNPQLAHAAILEIINQNPKLLKSQVFQLLSSGKAADKNRGPTRSKSFFK